VLDSIPTYTFIRVVLVVGRWSRTELWIGFIWTDYRIRQDRQFSSLHHNIYLVVVLQLLDQITPSEVLAQPLRSLLSLSWARNSRSPKSPTLHCHARFQVIRAVYLKIQVVWNVTPCSLMVTDVSKGRIAFILRVKQSNTLWSWRWRLYSSSEHPVTVFHSTRRQNILEELKPFHWLFARICY
jgi:hypothetical protein